MSIETQCLTGLLSLKYMDGISGGLSFFTTCSGHGSVLYILIHNILNIALPLSSNLFSISLVLSIFHHTARPHALHAPTDHCADESYVMTDRSHNHQVKSWQWS